MVEFVADTVVPDVIHVRPALHGDARGWFQESYRETLFHQHGIRDQFVQDNQSFSAPTGTLRGLHYQTAPDMQAKLVRCLSGRIFDVAVDIRAGSPTFGQYTSAILTAEKGEQLFVPEGFAHGFCTLEPNCMVAYKTSAEYAPKTERSIAFDDPEIGIAWPLKASALTLSDKDQKNAPFSDVRPLFAQPISSAVYKARGAT